jgi:threonine aldolase
MIDLRSDTVTKPTDEMRNSMRDAIVGDDVFGEDPTILLLENRVAEMFHKESALFFPSGTMSNLTALLTWCDSRGSEVIVGDKSHIFLFEQSGASQFGGISYRTLENNDDGTMDIEAIKKSIRENDIHEPITRLICIENTHNVCGGKILPLEFISKLRKIANQYHIPIHMDGARIWNAISASGFEVEEMVKNVDSISVCLSKGLGAPVGSLLVGTNEFIKKAKRIRKALGGGMRQSGILAAAGLVALDDFTSGILIKDHEKTRKIVDGLNGLKNMVLHPNIQTNIIFIDVLRGDASEISFHLKHENILVSAWSSNLLRIVIHRDISDENVDFIILKFIEVDSKVNY